MIYTNTQANTQHLCKPTSLPDCFSASCYTPFVQVSVHWNHTNLSQVCLFIQQNTNGLVYVITMCNHQKVTPCAFSNPPSMCSFSLYQETKDPGSSRGLVCGLWSRDREAWRQSKMAVQREGHRQWRQIRHRSWWKQAFPLHQSCHAPRRQHLRSDFRRVKGQVWAEGRIKARWETLMLQLCV